MTTAMPSRLTSTQLLLLVAFVYFLLIGGSSGGELTPIRVVDTVLGAVLVALWLAAMRRSADVVDKLVLTALLVFLAACLTSSWLRFSYDSATTVLAYTALYGIARRELKEERFRRLTVILLAASGTAVIAVFAVLWGSQWIQWVIVSGGHVPPLELELGSLNLYGYKYITAILIGMFLPFILAVRRPGLLTWLAGATVAVGTALVIMSGARSAWSGLAVAALVAIAIGIRPRHIHLPRLSRLANVLTLAGMGLLLAFVAVIGGAVLERGLTSSTISLRFDIWSYSLRQLGSHLLTGTGPGTFPTTITLNGYFQAFDQVGRGPDNALVQAISEAGLAGAVGIVLAMAAVAVAVRRGSNQWTRYALASVIVFAVSSVTNDSVHSGQLVGLTCLAAALAGPSVHLPETDPARRPSRVTAALTVAAATVLATAVGANQLAAVFYAQATAASASRASAQALRDVEMAVALDPKNGFYLQQLGLARLGTGDKAGAYTAFVQAASVSPADAAAMRGAALVADELGRPTEAAGWADRALLLRPNNTMQFTVRAYVARNAGVSSVEDAVLTDLLVSSPWLPAAPSWATMFPTGEQLRQLELRAAASVETPTPGARHIAQFMWLEAATGHSPVATDSTYAGIVALLNCDTTSAARLEQNAVATQSYTTWDTVLSAMLARINHATAALQQAATLGTLRDFSTGRRVENTVSGSSPFADTDALRLYGTLEFSLVTPDSPIMPTTGEALSWWMADPVAAARTAAPASGLAQCAAP